MSAFYPTSFGKIARCQTTVSDYHAFFSLACIQSKKSIPYFCAVDFIFSRFSGLEVEVLDGLSATGV